MEWMSPAFTTRRLNSYCHLQPVRILLFASPVYTWQVVAARVVDVFGFESEMVGQIARMSRD